METYFGYLPSRNRVRQGVILKTDQITFASIFATKQRWHLLSPTFQHLICLLGRCTLLLMIPGRSLSLSLWFSTRRWHDHFGDYLKLFGQRIFWPIHIFSDLFLKTVFIEFLITAASTASCNPPTATIPICT